MHDFRKSSNRTFGSVYVPIFMCHPVYDGATGRKSTTRRGDVVLLLLLLLLVRGWTTDDEDRVEWRSCVQPTYENN